MKEIDIKELKAFNNLIPSYLNSGKIKREKGLYLCPICNRPLTYVDGSNHIECEYCQDKNGKKLIRGYLSLLMYNENLSFKEAYKHAKSELSLFNLSVDRGEVKDYTAIDKRTIGVNYLNDRDNLLSIYDSDYINKPLIFSDPKTADLIYNSLIGVMEKAKMPNILAISNTNYVYNAMSVLMKMKLNHKIKLFLIFENEKDSNATKRHLLHDLYKYDFSNFIVVEDLINHDKEHTIQAHYKNNKDYFSYELKNIVSTFNARYKKPLLEGDIKEKEENTRKK